MKKTIVYHNRSIVYNILGQGNPVILLHGFAEDSSVYEKLIPALADQHCVLTIDLPGCGANLAASSFTTFDHCAAILYKIITKEQLANVAMLGHSMGGYIALYYAKHYTATLRSIGLLHSTAFADTHEKKQLRLKNIDFLNEHGTALFLKQTTPNLFAKNFVEENKQFVNDFATKMSYLPVEVLVNYTKAMIKRKESLELLTTSSLPFLFIIGTDDNAVPLANSLQQCYLPKTSYFHILNGVGHMGMYESPNQLSVFINNFLHEVG